MFEKCFQESLIYQDTIRVIMLTLLFADNRCAPAILLVRGAAPIFRKSGLRGGETTGRCSSTSGAWRRVTAAQGASLHCLLEWAMFAATSLTVDGVASSREKTFPNTSALRTATDDEDQKYTAREREWLGDNDDEESVLSC